MAGSAGMKRAERNALMLEAPVRGLILKMAFPTIVAMLITVIYNLADTYFVSSLGTNATAAVGVNGSLDRIITLFGGLLGSGAGSYIARLLGAKRREDADRVLSTCFLTGLAVGVLLMAAGLAFREPLVYLLGADENCADYSMQYARYVLIAAPFMLGQLILNMCLRNEGSATLAMVGVGFGGILNIVLDPIFIFSAADARGLGFGFGLGVEGASMATAISKFISFCILIFPYLRGKCTVALSARRFRFTRTDAKEVISIGSSNLLRQFGIVFSSVVLNHVAKDFSTAALAAMSVSNRIMEFPFAVILGFGGGFQPVIGFNWGAKRYDRVRSALRFGTFACVLGCVVMGGLIFLFATEIIGLFNSQEDPDVLRLGVLCISAQCITMPLHAWVSQYNMFYAGIGAAAYALLLSTARQFYCFVPLLLIIPRFFGEEGLACCLALSDVLSLLICIPTAVHAHRLLAEKENANA